MALLVLLPRATPTGIVAGGVLVVVLDPGLDHLAVAADRLRGGLVDRGGVAARDRDLFQRRGLGGGGAAGVVERRRLVGGRRRAVAAFNLDFGPEDQFAELVPDRVHQLGEHRVGLVFV